mmetsp:Transcript_29787/g.67394  ORF Transcript_29787/g.67394 Transcript_29787/m.67394 type:complete len:314 (-) Transcript_29787:163-1104(-)
MRLLPRDALLVPQRVVDVREARQRVQPQRRHLLLRQTRLLHEAMPHEVPQPHPSVTLVSRALVSLLLPRCLRQHVLQVSPELRAPVRLHLLPQLLHRVSQLLVHLLERHLQQLLQPPCRVLELPAHQRPRVGLEPLLLPHASSLPLSCQQRVLDQRLVLLHAQQPRPLTLLRAVLVCQLLCPLLHLLPPPLLLLICPLRSLKHRRRFLLPHEGCEVSSGVTCLTPDPPELLPSGLHKDLHDVCSPPLCRPVQRRQPVLVLPRQARPLLDQPPHRLSLSSLHCRQQTSPGLSPQPVLDAARELVELLLSRHLRG